MLYAKFDAEIVFRDIFQIHPFYTDKIIVIKTYPIVPKIGICYAKSYCKFYSLVSVRIRFTSCYHPLLSDFQKHGLTCENFAKCQMSLIFSICVLNIFAIKANRDYTSSQTKKRLKFTFVCRK